MAFTRVRGPGITTDDNYRVGIITATKFVGPMQASGDSDFTNISATGIGTIDGVKIGDPSGIVTASSSSGIVTYYGDASKLTGLTAGQIPNLAASKITSGTIDTARLGSGTANNTSFLRGDQTWASNTSTIINSNTNDYLITGTGTADTLQGESTLTYGTTGQLKITRASQSNVGLYVFHSDGNEVGHFGNIGSGNEGILVLKDGGTDTVVLNGETGGNSYIKSGKIGIGTVTPSEILTVHTASGNTKQVLSSHAGFSELDFVTASTLRADVFANASEFTFTTRTAIPIGFRTNGTNERLRIHSDGQITIGNDHAGAGTWTGQLVVATTTGGVITAGDTGSGEKLHLEGGSGLGRIGTTSNHDLVFVTNGTSNERLRINTNGEATVTATNTGNPIGLVIKNTNTANYSHGRLRIESQNGAKYTDIWTDVPNDACRIGYNSSNALYINGGNAFANTAVTNWHGDYKVFQAGQASLSGKNPQDGSPLYLSNNAYYDTTNSRWEFISTDDASQIEMENGSIKFKNGGTGSANGAITWVTNAWFNQSGNLRFRNGRGIDFGETSDVSGMVSEVLDDYEEGSFTMFFWTSNTNFSTAPTMTTNNCRYTKIGNQVSFTAYIAWNAAAAGGSGNLYLGGLPYAVNNYQSYGGVYFGWHNIGGGFAAHEYPTGYINNNSTNIVLMRQPIGAGGGRTYASLACSAIHGVTGTYSINGTYLAHS